MEIAKTRLHSLQKKQKETERMATLTGANEKRYVGKVDLGTNRI